EVAPVALEVAEDVVAGGADRLGQARLERAQLAVGQRRRFFQDDEGADEFGMLAEAADGIVLDGALRLRAVEGVVGNGDGAEGVAFESHLSRGVRTRARTTPSMLQVARATPRRPARAATCRGRPWS